MERFAAFLRGINVTGRRLKNEELRRLVAGLGFEEVATFRASGNVVFSSADGSANVVANALEEGLGDGLGYEVAVFLRTGRELLSIAASEPFTPRQVEASQGKQQVILLGERPSAAVRRRALALATEGDRLALEGRELHWLPSGGIMESELDRKALESLLGPTTTRTKGTVEEIAARHFA